MYSAAMLRAVFEDFCERFGTGKQYKDICFVRNTRPWEFAMKISDEKISRHTSSLREKRFPDAVIGFTKKGDRVQCRWWRRLPDRLDRKTQKIPQGIYTIELNEKTNQLIEHNNLGTHPSLRPYEGLKTAIDECLKRAQKRFQK